MGSVLIRLSGCKLTASWMFLFGSWFVPGGLAGGKRRQLMANFKNAHHYHGMHPSKRVGQSETCDICQLCIVSV